MGLAPTIRFSYLHTWVAVSKIKVWRVNPLRSNELNQVLLFLFFLKVARAGEKNRDLLAQHYFHHSSHRATAPPEFLF
jgi:hypothetical protein